MERNHKKNAFKMSHPKTLILSMLVTLLCLMLGAMLLSTFIISGSLDIKYMDMAGTVLIFITALIGSLFGKKMKGEGSGWLVVTYTAAMILAPALVNIIVWGGEFHNVLIKIAAVVLGSGISILDVNGKRKIGKRYKKR